MEWNYKPVTEVNLGNSQASVNLWSILNEKQVAGEVRQQSTGQSVMGNSLRHA